MPAPQQAGPAKSDRATVALRDLYTSEWNWRQQEFGYQTEDGEWKSTDRFPSNTPEAWDRRTTYWKQVLGKLEVIPVASLPHEEQVNAAVFRADVEALYNNATWRTYERPEERSEGKEGVRRGKQRWSS